MAPVLPGSRREESQQLSFRLLAFPPSPHPPLLLGCLKFLLVLLVMEISPWAALTPVSEQSPLPSLPGRKALGGQSSPSHPKGCSCLRGPTSRALKVLGFFGDGSQTSPCIFMGALYGWEGGESCLQDRVGKCGSPRLSPRVPQAYALGFSRRDQPDPGSSVDFFWSQPTQDLTLWGN